MASTGQRYIVGEYLLRHNTIYRTSTDIIRALPESCTILHAIVLHTSTHSQYRQTTPYHTYHTIPYHVIPYCYNLEKLKQALIIMSISAKLRKAKASIASALTVEPKDKGVPTPDAEDKPPPHESLGVSDEEAEGLIAQVDAISPTMGEGEWQREITFHFVPEIRQKRVSIRRLFRNREQEPTWYAMAEFRTRNIPRLMWKGLHISDQNIIKNLERTNLRGQSLDPFLPPGYQPGYWNHVRVWCLSSHPDIPDILCRDTLDEVTWRGILRVYRRAGRGAEISAKASRRRSPK